MIEPDLRRAIGFAQHRRAPGLHQVFAGIGYLTYRAADPYAVTLSAESRGSWIDWRIDRDTLATGVVGEDGLGDIKIWADPDCTTRTWVHLHNLAGCALLSFARDDLLEFLEGTFEIVQAGREGEHIDWTRELARLLKQWARCAQCGDWLPDDQVMCTRCAELLNTPKETDR